MAHDNEAPDPAIVAPEGTGATNPFRNRIFVVVWSATVVSNIGSWMYNVASGWLMMSLDSHPLVVSLVQVANALPMFLFPIPAGALVDIVDQRRYLIIGESAITFASAIFAFLVMLHAITPASLLALSFLVAIGSAFTAPAWQTVVSQLVSKTELPAAIAANSVGINVSRAIGPALGGVLVAAVGIVVPFWLDAVSNVGIIAALIWWRRRPRAAESLPMETFGHALQTGLRHARYNPSLRATLIRSNAFFVFASAYWALLPLVVSTRLGGGASLYGVLLAAIGVSAVSGAFFLRPLKQRLGADRLVAFASLATAVAMAIFAVARNEAAAIVASLIAGASWIAAVSSFNVSAQVALPEWVRGRGLAVYVTLMYGALTLGSVVWGGVASLIGVPLSLLIAAVGVAVMVPLSSRWKLQTGSSRDLSPSLQWPDPITTRDVEPDRGPVLVTIEYRIDPANRESFLSAVSKFSRERRRDGAYDCGIFEDAAQQGRYVETFLVDSWLEHLRQHRRVTVADSDSQAEVRRFHIGKGPVTTHLIGAKHA